MKQLYKLPVATISLVIASIGVGAKVANSFDCSELGNLAKYDANCSESVSEPSVPPEPNLPKRPPPSVEEATSGVMSVPAPTSTDEEKIEDVILEPGMAKQYEIETEQPVWISFTPDISLESAMAIGEEYEDREHYPFLLKDIDGDNSVSSTTGGGMVFRPKDGKVQVILSNDWDKSVSMSVYTRLAEPSDSPFDSLFRRLLEEL